MSGLLPLEFVLTPPPGAAVAYFGMFFLCGHDKQMSQKTPEWLIANLDKSDKVTLCLFGGWFVCRCQTSPCYFPSFFVIFDFRICQESYFSSSCSVFPGTWPKHFHFKATSCVCVCMYNANVQVCKYIRVCVCASALEFERVTGCWTPWWGQLSEIFCKYPVTSLFASYPKAKLLSVIHPSKAHKWNGEEEMHFLVLS